MVADESVLNLMQSRLLEGVKTLLIRPCRNKPRKVTHMVNWPGSFRMNQVGGQTVLSSACEVRRRQSCLMEAWEGRIMEKSIGICV